MKARKTSTFITFLIFGIVALIMSGCSGLVTKDYLKEQMTAHDKRIMTAQQTADDAKRVADGAKTATETANGNLLKVAGALKTTANAVHSAATSLSSILKRIDGTETRVNALESKSNVMVTALGTKASSEDLKAAERATTEQVVALVTKVAGVEKRVGGVDKKIQNVSGAVSNLGAKIGVMKHAGSGSMNDSVLVWGFPVARYDDKTKEFPACAELLPGVKAALDKVVAAANDEKIKVKKVVGYASRQPFKKDGVTRDDSDELNEQCGKLRAQKVAEYLDTNIVTQDVDTHEFGRITDDFGSDTTKNRGVVIEIEALKPTI